MTSIINSNISPVDIQKMLIDYVKIYSTEVLPQKLKVNSQWILWKPKYLPDKDKVSKIPVNPRTYQNASSTDPATWTSYVEAVKAIKTGYGIGFVLAPEDGLVGIDFDNCIVNGALEPWAQDLINEFDSYTEISPSGRGIRIFAMGDKPPGRCRKDRIEMYSEGRFLTITGNHVPATPLNIEPRQEAIDALHKKLIERNESKQPVLLAPSIITVPLSDSRLIQIAQKSKRGAEFTRLFNGDWQGAYESQSQADQAFMNMLAFWTQKDAAQMNSIMRQSRLYRPKWDEKHGAQTYGEMTTQRAIQDTTNVFEPKGRNPLIEARSNPPQQKNKMNFPHTDLGNAERLVDKFGDDLFYCYELKKWFLWNGKQWQEDKKGQIFHFATLTVRAMIKDAENLPDDARMDLIKWSLKSESRDKIKAMVDLAQNEPSVVISYNQFDRDPWLLNLQNGTLNLKTGKLQPHRREDFCSKISPVEYDVNAKAPRWELFVNEIMSDKIDLINYLQKISGYSMTGITTEHDVYICFGGGANGKSVFINTLITMLGPDYTKQTTASALLVKQSESVGEEIAILAGARFVATIEIEDGKRLAEGLVKQLSGGDKIRARFLYGNSFEFQPVLKLWMATNHKPRVSGTDAGIWRRLKLLPFTVFFSEDQQDRQLSEKLKAELPGIFNWCIEGCLKWQAEGLNPPPTEVMAATTGYREENDSIGTFLRDACITGITDYRSTAKELYNAYCLWCEDGGERPISQRKFGSRLRERGFASHIGTGNKTFWNGLGVRTDRMDTENVWQGIGKVIDMPNC